MPFRSLGSPVALGARGCRRSQAGDTTHPACNRILTVQPSPRSARPSDWVTVLKTPNKKGRDWLTLCESSPVGGERALSYLAKKSKRGSAPLPPRAVRWWPTLRTLPAGPPGPLDLICLWSTKSVINRPTGVILSHTALDLVSGERSGGLKPPWTTLLCASRFGRTAAPLTWLEFGLLCGTREPPDLVSSLLTE